jgi:hypothetical protein
MRTGSGATTLTAPQSKGPWKNPVFYSSIVLGIALFVVGWIFYSRWEENRLIEHRSLEKKSQKQMENDRIALEQLGGKELGIQTFYAIPAAIRRGETVELCYGVANAKAVKLEPQTNPVWPSYARCVDVAPTKDTTYTLTITDAAGNTKTQTLDVKVR